MVYLFYLFIYLYHLNSRLVGVCFNLFVFFVCFGGGMWVFIVSGINWDYFRCFSITERISWWMFLLPLNAPESIRTLIYSLIYFGSVIYVITVHCYYLISLWNLSLLVTLLEFLGAVVPQAPPLPSYQSP